MDISFCYTSELNHYPLQKLSAQFHPKQIFLQQEESPKIRLKRRFTTTAKFENYLERNSRRTSRTLNSSSRQRSQSGFRNNTHRRSINRFQDSKGTVFAPCLTTLQGGRGLGSQPSLMKSTSSRCTSHYIKCTY